MPQGTASGWGIRSLADSYLRYFQPGTGATYLILRQVQTQGLDYARLGFQLSVTGGGPSGVSFILIDPPPDVSDVSLTNIGLLGATLRFGARIFLISHTFVLAQVAARGLTDMYDVFRDPLVVGLLYNNRMFSLDSITHEDAGGEPLLWKIVGNEHDIPASFVAPVPPPNTP